MPAIAMAGAAGDGAPALPVDRVRLVIVMQRLGDAAARDAEDRHDPALFKDVERVAARRGAGRRQPVVPVHGRMRSRPAGLERRRVHVADQVPKMRYARG
jgi:hypothetical protein